jgi:hypothetical protein
MGYCGIVVGGGQRVDGYKTTRKWYAAMMRRWNDVVPLNSRDAGSEKLTTTKTRSFGELSPPP